MIEFKLNLILILADGLAFSFIIHLYAQGYLSPKHDLQKKFDNKNLVSQTDSTERAGIELFPILSYDTDAGFGYGAKAFFYNQLNSSESFDIILFNSTKGEQGYKAVFSTPDFESRDTRPCLPAGRCWILDTG